MDIKEAVAQKKSWSEEEKLQAIRAAETAEAKKTSFIRFLDQLVFWTALLTAVIGNFILSVVIVPFLLIMTGWMLYATLFFIGLSFGLLFTTIIGYAEKIEKKQHIVAGIFIPAIALINVWLITYFANKLIILLQLTTETHSPGLVSITYVAAFVLPYLISRSRKIVRK